jgi:tRNA threonylcarbamoyladenosine biosynthesis protein TsaE
VSHGVEVNSIEAMHEFGATLGSQLRTGDLILLSGPLGAGKTALTQGIGRALGITGITSPTFVISRIHQGKIRLVHVDAYRMQENNNDNTALFDDLDLESYLESSVTVVEWGEGLASRISDSFLELKLSFGVGEKARIIEIIKHGVRWNSLVL